MAPARLVCQYCHQPVVVVLGAELYPNLKHLWHIRDQLYYKCEPCQAWIAKSVRNTQLPVPVANAALRAARMAAHETFDPMWKSGAYRRTDAYKWLAQKLGLAVDDCHIGLFDAAMCQRVIEMCERHYRQEQ